MPCRSNLGTARGNIVGAELGSDWSGSGLDSSSLLKSLSTDPIKSDIEFHEGRLRVESQHGHGEDLDMAEERL
jgi:hypothetical protein